MNLTVLDTTGLVTVQDAGRPGHAHLGVPRAGWLDEPAAGLANRLVGNEASCAVLELTLGSVALRCPSAVWVAATGAPCAVTVDGHAVAFAEPVRVAAGSVLSLGTPASGVRTYLAVGGGIAVDPVLGSRSTDTLAWVGPAPVTAGATLPVGTDTGEPQALDTPRPPVRGPLRLLPGPRADWFDADPVDLLAGSTWSVGAASNRVGMRLEGPGLRRAAAYDGRELASEGMVLGAVQVPPDGQPVVFLADHPVTGGYPVAAVVHPDDLWMCAQVRPGETVRFRRG
ncbi:biotin-dependent carboxyltransferase family protein [Nocardioides jiangxiensis]|uniref:Biotin-dependent carboxyltransferase family protein n=1 Tax=Nocardioides jiangxiensis TaxID=3064524 RepID=A0ABT9B3K6_9ACTN|nr:biotin-dependent carboxyltransferase family protein [Nocardioides sp. WY-20]MDO7869421.1 biotin-dependent carboxyltransferase family protein [Nocardioides sp. WY-20]